MSPVRGEGLVVAAPMRFEAHAVRRGAPAANVIRRRIGPRPLAGRGAARPRGRQRGGAHRLRRRAVAGARAGRRSRCQRGTAAPTKRSSARDRVRRVDAAPRPAFASTPGRSSRSAASSSERSASAWQRTGAIAVDMESAWLAAGAAPAARGRRAAVLDTATASLITPRRDAGRSSPTGLWRAPRALSRVGRADGPRRVLLAAPRSFCAGVERAIDIVERALERTAPPVYVRRQIVHNTHVVATWSSAAPCSSRRSTRFRRARPSCSPRTASRRRCARPPRAALEVIDATCPLVTKVHAEARRFAAAGYRSCWSATRATRRWRAPPARRPRRIQADRHARRGRARSRSPDPDRVAYLTQTTLAVDEIDERRRRAPRAVPGAGRAAGPTTSATPRRTARTPSRAGPGVRPRARGRVARTRRTRKRLVEVAERAGLPGAPRRRRDRDRPGVARRRRHGRRHGRRVGARALVERVVGALASLGPLDGRGANGGIHRDRPLQRSRRLRGSRRHEPSRCARGCGSAATWCARS